MATKVAIALPAVTPPFLRPTVEAYAARLTVADFLQLDTCSNVSAEVLQAFQAIPATALLKLLPAKHQGSLTANLAELVEEFLHEHEGDIDADQEGNSTEDKEQDGTESESDGCDEESEPGEAMYDEMRYLHRGFPLGNNPGCPHPKGCIIGTFHQEGPYPVEP